MIFLPRGKTGSSAFLSAKRVKEETERRNVKLLSDPRGHFGKGQVEKISGFYFYVPMAEIRRGWR